MPIPISSTVPAERLRRLEFMLGESSGLETLYPPDGPPVQFQAHVLGSWEHCERFIKLDYYADIPGFGPESFQTMITWSDSMECYRMWAFASSQEEPMHLAGDFVDDAIVFVSDPTKMIWGLQRLRFTISSHRDGAIELLGERWEPDGYAKHCSVIYRPADVCV